MAKKKAVKKAAPKKAKPVSKAPRKVAKSVKAKPAKKPVKHVVKVIKRPESKPAPVPLAELPPDHVDLLQKMVEEAKVPEAKTEATPEAKPEVKPVAPPEKGDIVLQVNVRKWFFWAVKNVEVLIMANEKPFDRQMSDEKGEVYFKQLSPGDYVLAVTIKGQLKTKPVNVKEIGAVTFRV
jgi:hypothetical protein